MAYLKLAQLFGLHFLIWNECHSKKLKMKHSNEGGKQLWLVQNLQIIREKFSEVQFNSACYT